MSNFEWTDKDSVRWFILMPGGHEGPYSLDKLILLLEKKKISKDVRIWSEGLAAPILFKEALERSQEAISFEEGPLEDDIPDDIPPIPVEEEFTTPLISGQKPKYQFPARGLKFFLVILVIGTFVLFFKKDQFTIPRLSKMSLEIHQRILTENYFDGWDKKIFFREYMPLDHSHIWLVTSGYQKCEVEASFNSIQDKLLSYGEEKISFKSKGKLTGHVVEFESFDFVQGNKIIPGLYEMDVKATNCIWDGYRPRLMNFFQEPDREYIARTKVILFSKGPTEFNLAIDNILRKKIELAERAKNQEVIFWQDLTQKFQTLEAISLQIEQHLLDFLEKNPSGFKQNSKIMVDQYSKKFGSFLTSFVVDSENYFKSVDGKGASRKRNYELMVRLTSKKIGLESMKLIEEFLSIKKKVTKKDLSSLSNKVRKKFSDLKKEISEKLAQILKDQDVQD